MNINGDIAALLDVEIFGTEAVLRPASAGNAVRIAGIFDAAFTTVEAGGSVGYATTSPRFLCASADLPTGLEEGYLLTVSSVTYTIRVVEPDGTGMTALMLEKA